MLVAPKYSGLTLATSHVIKENRQEQTEKKPLIGLKPRNFIQLQFKQQARLLEVGD
ncbi:MAG TPA: hypothetical protein PK129_07910 [Cellvibrionaceae bacterium]|nr:hypothetical protein [Cellvibrionaceae bacterium]